MKANQALERLFIGTFIPFGLILLTVAGRGTTTTASEREFTKAETAAPVSTHRGSRALFARVWTVTDGLGPLFNARSCAGCHATPTPGGSGTDPRAFVATSSSVTDPTGGHVFRRLRVDERGGVTERERPEGATLRKAPALFGLGALEAVPEADMRAVADPDDRNGDRVRGRVGFGRFGWKARFRTLEDTVAAAFANELGLASAVYPDTDSQHGGRKHIEISADQIALVAAFVRRLPPLAPRPLEPRIERAGLATFKRIGCASCHRPLVAGSVPAYTDLLLHDMGPALADGIAEGAASGRDFRTPPLWGLSRTGPPYLHDGRAPTIDAAIREHGGEAARSAAAYRAVSPAERTMVLEFLGSR